jgi:class 3 adenylate cyclase
MGRQRTGFFRFDGYRIGFATVGEGPPLVLPAWWVSNVVEDWKGERFRRFIEALAEAGCVIRYDRLGSGISDRVRPRETLTIDYEVALLGALIDHLGLGRFSFFGESCGGCAAVIYAVANRDRVDRLVLYGTYANGADIAAAKSRHAMLELVRTHWGLGSRMLADVFLGSEGADEHARFVSSQRVSATAEIAADLLELTYETDVSEVLPQLGSPTLVVHRRLDRAIPLRCGEQVAALAPNAALVVLDGDAHVPWLGDTVAVLASVAPFLGIAMPTAAATPVAVADRFLATVLFTDIVGATARAAELGDRAWRELVQRHNSAVRNQLSRFRGTEVDTAGDGFLATFEVPARAIGCAREIVDAVRQLGLEVRAGLHTGECERINGKVGGIAVHIGARVLAQAHADEVLVSSTVKDLVAGSGIEFEDRGVKALRGVPERWRLYAVRAIPPV